jgi:hypothetical protein
MPIVLTRRVRLGGLTAATLLGAALVSGCGHAAPSAAAATQSTSRQASALKFSQCMRAHGISDFPDPSSGGAISISGGPSSDMNPDNATFSQAQQACRSLLPNGGQMSPQQQQQMQQQALAFSQCMRSHGVTDFPDPQFQSGGGGVGIRINGKGGGDLNPDNPTFQHAQQACQSLLGHVGPGGHGGGPTTSTGSGSGQGFGMQVAD